jgi:hypothetical protein
MTSMYDFNVKCAILWYRKGKLQYFNPNFVLVYFSEESSFAAVIMVQTDQKKVMVNENHCENREKCSNWPVIKPIILMKSVRKRINEHL